MHDIVEEGKEKGFVTTMFMRRRYLPELIAQLQHTVFWRTGCDEHPDTGKCRGYNQIAMVKVHGELKKRKLKSRLILQVHDELIVETFKMKKKRWKRFYLKACKCRKSESALVVEIKSGSNWYETK